MVHARVCTWKQQRYAGVMRAVTYLRQSIDSAEGIDRQRERTRKLIGARDWTFTQEFVDNDVSASKQRGRDTGWARMLESDAEVVVAVDLDRLLRDVRDLSVLIDSGKKVVTVDGEIDLSTADGEFRATMLAGIARFEVRRKSERQRRANDARARAGRWVGGRRPFGFEDDGMTLRADEAQAIRDGFRAYVAGDSLSEIGRAWTAAGFTTGQGGVWERTAVRAVLTNPRYIAKVRHRGDIVADAVWPAVVDEDTWEATQALVNGARGRRTRARSLLTGIALCGVCEAPLHAGGNARAGVRGYRCGASQGHVARMAEPVEQYVDALVSARLDMPDAANLAHSAEASPEDRERLAVLRVRREALGVEFADGNLTAEQVRAATERLTSQIRELESRLADSGRSRVLAGLGSGAAYRALPAVRRRQIIDTLLRVRVMPPGRGVRTFRPESVLVEWR